MCTRVYTSRAANVHCTHGTTSSMAGDSQNTGLSPGDPSSFSLPEECLTKHVHIELDVDFETNVLKGNVVLKAETKGTCKTLVNHNDESLTRWQSLGLIYSPDVSQWYYLAESDFEYSGTCLYAWYEQPSLWYRRFICIQNPILGNVQVASHTPVP